jgi:hypothetical protein
VANMKFNLLMILICIIALAAIAFRMGLIMEQTPEPLQTYDPSFITYHGSLWSPPIVVTTTPNTNIWPISEPKQPVVQKQCLKFLDSSTICQ